MVVIVKIIYIIMAGCMLKLFYDEEVLLEAAKNNYTLQNHLWLGFVILCLLSLLWPALVIIATYQVFMEGD